MKQVIRHSCGHIYEWEPLQPSALWLLTTHLWALLGAPCPPCGGETGRNTLYGQEVPNPQPDEALTFLDEHGEPLFVAVPV